MELATRERLLDIATNLFAKHGYNAVSVRMVTQKAKINVSAISYHFKGKDGLYQAVLEHQLKLILEALEVAKNNKADSPLEKLSFYAQQVAVIHKKRPLLSRFMTSEIANPTAIGGATIECHIAQSYQYIQELLQEGIDKGVFKDTLDPIFASVSLVGILNFYYITKPLTQKFIPQKLNSGTEYNKQALEIYLKGILTENC